jgi:signal transduction histidine kinase
MRRRFIPYSLLLAGLALTTIAVQYALRTAETSDRLRFENAAERVRSAIDSRLDAYVAMLLGGAGLFAASDDVEWSEFKAYVERLKIEQRYPGVRGIGFSQVIRPEERAVILSVIRRRVPEFAYPSESGSSSGHAIVFLEPLDERNRVALGYDMYAEENRRDAMDRARDTALPAATRRVRLVQEIDKDKQQAGFLIYVPVYRGGDVPAAVEERRAQLLGFVYSPFRAWDLLRPIQEEFDPAEVTFDVSDGAPRDRQWLHTATSEPVPSRFHTELTTDVAGRTWTLVVHSGPAFAGTSGRTIAGLIAAIGILMSVLLWSVTTTLVKARHAAERMADDARRSEEALRDANRAKDEFLAVVSHELRTPLNAIVGWASMLRRGQVPPQNQAHAIEIIQRNAAAQTRLIEDLLDISRAVAGRLSLELEDVDVDTTLKTAADAVRPAADQQGVKLALQSSGSLGTIRADHARLQQVVLNVLANGIKFTPEGGEVCLAASRANGWVTMNVSDTGLGIPPSFLPHVFESFRQGDSSTTRVHGGVGLGLAISRHITELHGGTIEAASDGVGLGATFTIRLPANPPAST